MVFYVAKQLLRYFISDSTGERDEHGLGERLLHELSDESEMFSYERTQVAGFGTEAEGDGQLQEETDMEVAEVGTDGIQQHNVLFTPFKEARFIDPVLDCPIKDFAEEHGHGILENITSYT